MFRNGGCDDSAELKLTEDDLHFEEHMQVINQILADAQDRRNIKGIEKKCDKQLGVWGSGSSLNTFFGSLIGQLRR